MNVNSKMAPKPDHVCVKCRNLDKNIEKIKCNGSCSKLYCIIKCSGLSPEDLIAAKGKTSTWTCENCDEDNTTFEQHSPATQSSVDKLQQTLNMMQNDMKEKLSAIPGIQPVA
jgi:hypothetical protein